jgi:hypothetical protein
MRRSFASVRRASLLPELLAVASLLLLVTGLIRSLTPKKFDLPPGVPCNIDVETPKARLPVALPLELPAPQARPTAVVE